MKLKEDLLQIMYAVRDGGTITNMGTKQFSIYLLRNQGILDGHLSNLSLTEKGCCILEFLDTLSQLIEDNTPKEALIITGAGKAYTIRFRGMPIGS